MNRALLELASIFPTLNGNVGFTSVFIVVRQWILS
jgi:hypothetical protein